jgi:cell surface protein SprA
MLSIVFGSRADISSVAFSPEEEDESIVLPVDSPGTSGDSLPYPFEDNSTSNPLWFPNNSGLTLDDPSNIQTSVEYDPATGNYNVSQKMGNMDYRPPTYMDQEEYLDYELKKSVKDYWRQRTHAETMNETKPIIPKLHVGGEVFDRIFGGNTVDIRPQGSAELIFGVNTSKTDNPQIPEKQRKISTFEFNEKIQLNVIGKIGDKLKLTTSYNTEATFDFENQMKLEYTGYEDEIIKKIEAGNVSLPLNGSLITGSQSLFGIKTQLQFGRLTATTIFSQQKGKKSEVEVTGGAQTNKYEIAGDNYDANKHYFLTQYFRDQFNSALASLPIINSPISITRVEVWVTNRTATTENTRNIVALSDLGEVDSSKYNAYVTTGNTPPAGVEPTPGVTLPANNANELNNILAPGLPFRNSTQPGYINPVQYMQANTVTLGIQNGLQPVKDFEYIEQARRLQPTEFTVNTKLGFISLNQALNYDEVLAVAFQYTINNQTFQVGEFSTDLAAPNALVVKLLKSQNVSVRYPMWDLMMKNIYSIGAYQVNPEDFRLEIWYNNRATGVDVPYIPEGSLNGKPLIQVMDLDKLNSQGDPSPDGVFDFIDGVTINASNGRIIFPEIEPFGNDLMEEFQLPGEGPIAVKYTFQELYDSTRTRAQQLLEKNRYKLKGQYKSSSSSDISLNAVNIPQGSVTVTAGGIALQENLDYTVDYALGRVKIINEGILNSGTPIKISLESNSLFNIQSKSLLGTHLDYRVNKDFTVGGTVLNLTERPITNKINIGDEPISNTIWGLDANYRTEAPFLTRWIDKLPLLETKELSNITFAGEFAHLIPGHSKAIGKNGNSYIDDFEGSQTTIDIKSQAAWVLSSVPQDPALFPEAFADSLKPGYNRARLSWYVIDPLFLRDPGNISLPSNINNDQARSNNFTREILETELFPNKEPASGQPINIPTLDLAYYPHERGQYNYVVNDGTNWNGLYPNGSLKSPETRWGGMMRKIETNDFEAANIEFIQFWVMDPFNGDTTAAGLGSATSGNLYINLGNVSEDILKDSRRSYENGLPVDASNSTNVPLETTVWGKVPLLSNVVNAFDNDPNTRLYQDVGLDGLRDDDELSFHSSYISQIAAAYGTSSGAYSNATTDPSADNYHYFRGSDYDNSSLTILQRYKMYNGMEGNSPASGQATPDAPVESYPVQATNTPNREDINNDNTLSTSEGYYQYHIKLTPGDINPTNVGNNYITDVVAGQGTKKDGQPVNVYWYQFKIPVKDFEDRIGNIEDFKSIRFIRMFLKDVDTSIVLRFARLELVRGDWRRYDYSLLSPGEYIPNDDDQTSFDVTAVNIEENGTRVPVNYVLPPGIDRETNAQSANMVKLNEQSMSIRVCNLPDGDSRAAFKNTDFDVRSYKKLQMFVHAEARGTDALNDNDLSVFVRLGTDYTDNYYEYEIPLKVTPAGNYNGSDEVDQYKVWPDQNRLELAFEVFQKFKQQRNIDMVNNPGLLTQEATYMDGNNIVRVKGNPNLSNVRMIMIGVRNPNTPDDQAKCGEIWVNELRLTDFDEQGGWAATARMTAKLADFGTLTLAGNMSTPGFGSIEKKVSERSKETIKAYDVSSNLELGKFIPEKVNIRIPMYVGYSEQIRTPQFNPLDPDIELKNVLNPESGLPVTVRDSIKKVTEDYTKRKSINFTNVKKEKGKNSKKAHFYDVENISLSYAYTELFFRNINTEYNTTKTHRGAINYNYSSTPKNIKPFGKSKSKFMKSKYMTLIRDFNFYPMPNKFSFTTDVDRLYNEAKNRNTTGSDIIINPTFNKNFTMSRMYDLKYDISKSLKLDFTANADARVLEPEGRIDTEEERDTIRENILGLGKPTHYRHTTSLSYNIPINKLPLMDFATGTVRYSANYDWTRAPFAADTIGNVVMNSNSWQWNGQLNMVTLYNKIPYFKKVNQKSNKNAPNKGNNKSPVPNPLNKAAEDSTKKKKDDPFEIMEYVARLVMSVRNVSVNYTDNSGTTMPGYKPGIQIMGLDEHFEGPGAGFIFGQQESFGPNNENFANYAANQGWLVQIPSLNAPYTTTNTKNFNARANLEPLPDMKIELTGNRNVARNTSEFYRWNDVTGQFEGQSPMETGNFSMSIITWKTAFRKDDKNNVSETFQQFLNNRPSVSAQLGQEAGTQALGTGYYQGFGPTSQQVLIPAFLSAYSGKNPDNTSTSPFPKVPLPNWRITYDGLIKIDLIKKFFKTFTLSHAYRSTYNVGSYSRNLLYAPNTPDAEGNFIVEKQINTVSISEQLSPLIKVDVTWKNSLLTNLEVKTDRTLSLSFSNNQVTEVNGREYIIGSGYRLRDIPLPFKIGKKKIKSDLNLKADVSFRNNQTVIRRIVEQTNQATSGQNTISIKTSADYVISERLNVRLFWDKNISNPLVSTSYPTSNANAGLSIRFTLAQ